MAVMAISHHFRCSLNGVTYKKRKKQRQAIRDLELQHLHDGAFLEYIGTSRRIRQEGGKMEREMDIINKTHFF